MTDPAVAAAPPVAPATEGSTDDSHDNWKVQRDQEKSFGDNAFRAQDYATAVHHYSAALSLDPTNHILLSNRSAAYLSSQQKSRAFQDAQECIKHAPENYFKGYSRLAAALQSLGRYGPAKEAWEKVLAADSNNAAAKQGLDAATKALGLQQEAKAVAAKGEEEEEESFNSVADDNEKDKGSGDDDMDDLDDFFNDVEEAAQEVTKAKEEEALEQPKATNKIKYTKKDLGSAEFQIERLLEPNYEWRNLNPFYVLSVTPDATNDDISRRYKALSLLLHPDKNRNHHDRAELAYDQVQKAKAMLLDDEHKAKNCRDLAKEGMRQGKRDWEQSKKTESLPTPTTKTTTLEECQTKAVMKIFAQIEYKRREVEKRQRSQEQRERAQEDEELDRERNAMKFEKSWKKEGRVDKRVGNWRDFSTKKKKHQL